MDAFFEGMDAKIANAQKDARIAELEARVKELEAENAEQLDLLRRAKSVLAYSKNGPSNQLYNRVRALLAGKE